MDNAHVPVLLKESVELLAIKPGDIVVDCTFGRGGHTRAFLDLVGGNGLVIGLDMDPSAAEEAKTLSDDPHFKFVPVNFRNLDVALRMAGVKQVDKVFFDLGVSSPQFDQGDRGFSYKYDAPLDMRMNTAQSLTAADILNHKTEAEISRILWAYGEERWAKRIAQFIVEQRTDSPLNTTSQLVDVIRAAIPRKVRDEEDQHPARRTFQALRIAVNDELGSLEEALRKSVVHLKPRGRVGCISFHSLEDRIVKQFFVAKARQCLCPPGIPECVCQHVPELVLINRKPATPLQAELKLNPRSRSAKLRVAEKLEVF